MNVMIGTGIIIGATSSKLSVVEGYYGINFANRAGLSEGFAEMTSVSGGIRETRC